MLDISANELEFLPPEIGLLVNLSNLNLRHNRISNLPVEVANLTKLDKLNLEYNRIRSLPPLRGPMNLSDIRLKYNRVTSLPDVVGHIKEVLDVQNNCLTEIPQFSNTNLLCDLKELILVDNQLTTLPATPLSALTSLTRLHLMQNKIHTWNPRFLSSQPALTELDLRDNKISEIPTSINQCVGLKRLILCSNKLTQIPAEIYTISGLNILNLGGNYIEELPQGINQLSNLKELILANNKLTTVQSGIYALTQLQVLNLSWNDITVLDAGIGNMAKLAVLFLNGNKLKELPPEIGSAKSVKELYVAANLLTGLPETITEMKLELIDIRYNRLAGTFCPNVKWTQLKHFEHLDCGQNDPAMTLGPDFDGKERMHINSHNSLHHGGAGTNGKWSIAVADMKGKRWSMEDSVVVIPNYITPPAGTESSHDSNKGFSSAYFGVFDGHGGDKAAQHGAKRHPEILLEKLNSFFSGQGGKWEEEEDDVIEAIRSSFVETSKEMTNQIIKRSGTTAVVCIIINERLYVADVGDSRAVMYSKILSLDSNSNNNNNNSNNSAGEGHKLDNILDAGVLRISLDHKPDLPGEEKRIRNLNGFVSPNGRVVGMLAVSRALGDIDLQPFVSAEPFVDVIDIAGLYHHEEKLEKGEKGEGGEEEKGEKESRGEVKSVPDFLVMACDGVWDVISDETACEIVRSELDRGTEGGRGGDLVRSSLKLRDCAYAYGSLDNISVIAAKFRK
eukprot:TRINITY_DN6491_c0_g1_i2.p1 TRINITY_DN6491_c0_g1~~TRINITY_DN6491_c0_g1_i2.p1  ORF type:complete len:732 (-),score=175.60 TRINITY_DN6491_c0_g1_i2:92-2287(-)